MAETTDYAVLGAVGIFGYIMVRTTSGITNTVGRVADAPISVVESGAGVVNTVFDGSAGILEGTFDFAGSAPSEAVETSGNIFDGVTNTATNTFDKVTSWKFTGF